MEEPVASFGDWLKGVRVAAGHTQQSLARAIVDDEGKPKSRTLIAGIEADEIIPPDHATCVAIGTALGLADPEEVWRMAAPERLQRLDPHLAAWHREQLAAESVDHMSENEVELIRLIRETDAASKDPVDLGPDAPPPHPPGTHFVYELGLFLRRHGKKPARSQHLLDMDRDYDRIHEGLRNATMRLSSAIRAEALAEFEENEKKRLKRRADGYSVTNLLGKALMLLNRFPDEERDEMLREVERRYSLLIRAGHIARPPKGKTWAEIDREKTWAEED